MRVRTALKSKHETCTSFFISTAAKICIIVLDFMVEIVDSYDNQLDNSFLGVYPISLSFQNIHVYVCLFVLM